MAVLSGFAALDWIIRVYLPLWLDAAGRPAAATALRTSPVVDRAARFNARVIDLNTAMTQAWDARPVGAIKQLQAAENHYKLKGLSVRVGIEAWARNCAAVGVATNHNVLGFWRKLVVLVIERGGTQALDTLAADVAAALAGTTLG